MAAEVCRLELAPLDQLHDAPRRAHHDVRLGFELFDLPIGRRAADQQHRADRAPCILRKVAGLTMDLDGQLVRGRNDHDLRRGLRRIDAREEGKQIRQCLAGARLRVQIRVFPGQQHRNRRALNGRRIADLLFRQGGDEVGRQQQIGKRHGIDRARNGRQRVSYGMPFSELGLSPELLQAIGEANYVAPTPVQVAAIPPILRGQDVRACAQTGSGKTAAFALPMLQRLLGRAAASDRQVSGLVLVPTRELATQVGESFRSFSRYLPQPIKVLTVFGGVSINPQMMALRGGADIVVATPGRLLDLADHNAVRLSEVSTLVLDEADRLLDEGFADELTRVLALLPDRRQNLLFSATFPPAVQSLAELLLRDPVRIDVAATADDHAGHSTALHRRRSRAPHATAASFDSASWLGANAGLRRHEVRH